MMSWKRTINRTSDAVCLLSYHDVQVSLIERYLQIVRCGCGEELIVRYGLKYFLGLAPEDPVIGPSSLTKFRKIRVKAERLLDLLIAKSVQIVIELGLIKSNILIVNATHIKAHCNHKKPQEVLRERSKTLRKTIYQYSENIKAEFPNKPQEDALEAELKYTQDLLSVLEKHDGLTGIPAVSQKLNYLKEAGEDVLEHLESSVKEEARIGHKSADSSFFGTKNILP